MSTADSTMPATEQRIQSLESGRIRELDGWRAVAVSMVVLAHFIIERHAAVVAPLRGLERTIRYSGYLGVQIFFVISGFVICRLLLREEARYGSFSLKNFYYRRICRILPPFYLYLAVLFFLSTAGWIQLPRHSAGSAGLFLYDFHSYQRPWFTGHSWSLAIEEQFYLLFPLTLMLTPRRYRIAVCVAISVGCVLWTTSMIFTGWNSLLSSGVRAGFAAISYGVLVAMLETPARALAARVPGWIIALLALILIIHPVTFNNGVAALYESTFAPLAVAVILLFSLDRGRLLRGFLCSRLVQAVGLSSYGIYLWQELFTGRTELYFGPGRKIPVLIPLLLVIVPASYFLIEKPAMRYGRLLSRREAVETQPVRVGA